MLDQHDTQTKEINFNDTMLNLDQKAQQQALVEQERAEEEAKKNHNFVQFTRPGLLKLSKLQNAFAIRVLMWLAKEMDRTASIVVSQQTLADIFEVRRETINIAIKDLTTAGIVKIVKSGAAHVICINASVIWNTYRTNLKLAKFNATVIASEKEQGIRKQTLKQITKKEEK